jgi:hypothetical protein
MAHNQEYCRRRCGEGSRTEKRLKGGRVVPSRSVYQEMEEGVPRASEGMIKNTLGC